MTGTQAAWFGQARGALAMGAAIALYGNLMAVVEALAHLPLGGVVGGPLLGLGALAVALRGGRQGLVAIGVRRRGLVPSLLWGVALGLAMGLPGALYFFLPHLAPVPVRSEVVRGLPPGALLALVLGQLPLATALAEELAFRGLLQARLRAAFGPRPAIWLSALAFVAWHVAVNLVTLLGTNLAADPLLALLGYLGQNAAVLVGGLLLGLLRERSGNLAGAVVAHWLTDTLLIAGLYLG